MIVKKTKFKNGREIYRKADFLEKIKYYENEIYSIVFSVGMLVVTIFLFTGIIKFYVFENYLFSFCFHCERMSK